MAATLTLSVDTTQYQRALADAKSAMQQFGLDTSRVQDQIKKVGSALDGSKIVAQANAAVAAIQGIGGATRLTDAEAVKYNKTITEATAKARAMGAEVPQQWAKVSSELQAATKHTGAWGTALGSIKTVAAGFVAGFTLDRVVQGLGRAIGETIAWGGAITDLSAKTGVSMSTLQKWEYAAKQSGNTLDQVVTASLQLSKRIEEGDKAVGEAITGLGLSLSSLQAMRPEQQFNAVAEALAKTSDQGERASAAMALFGRSGADLLPTLTADMKALGDEAERLGVIVDEQTLKAMDDLGDSWQKMKDAGRGLLAEVLSPMVPELNRLAGAASNAAKTFREDFLSALFQVNEAARNGLFFGAMFGQQFGGPGKPTYTPSSSSTLPTGVLVPGVTTSETLGPYFTPGVDDFVNGVRMVDLDPKLKAAAEAAAKHAAEMAEFAKEAAVRWRNIVLHSDFLMARMGQVAMGFTAPGLEAATVLGGQANPWGGVGMLAPGGGSANFSHLTRPGFSWSGFGAGAFNMAAPLLGNMLPSNRGTQVGGMLGGMGAALGVSLGSIGGALGSVLPGIGTIAGMAIGSLLGKLLGPSKGAILGREADQRMDQTRAGLLQQYGSVDNIRALGPYGSALADAWGSKNVEGEAWFNRLNEGLQEQLDLQSQIKDIEEQRKALVESLVPTWEQLTAAASRYGFDLNELGTQVQQLGSTATFKTILEDLDLFGRATDDVGAYLSRMSGQISLAVQQALRFGTEVPENMKPFIQNLLETGQLLDENGNAITDLSALRWGPAIQTQADIVREAIEKLNDTFDKLTAKLEELFDKLANGLPDAAARGAAGANSAFGQIEPVVPGGDRGVEGFANGSGGIRDFGRGTLAVLHGREAVLTERQLRNMGGGVAVTVNVAGYLDSQVSRSHLASVVASEIGRELRVRRRA